MIKNKFLDIRLNLKYRKQKDFADFLGISQAQYSKYENNKEQPSIQVFYRISQRLNMSIDDLIEDEEE